MPLNSDFLKQLKPKLLELGYNLDEYISKPSSKTYYKKIGEYYHNLHLFTDINNIFVKISVSPLIHANIYKTGSDLKHGIILEKDLYNLVREETGRYDGYWLNLEKFTSVEESVSQFLIDLKSSKKYIDDSIELFNSSHAVKKRVEYIKSVAQYFIDNQSYYENMSESEFFSEKINHMLIM